MATNSDRPDFNASEPNSPEPAQTEPTAPSNSSDAKHQSKAQSKAQSKPPIVSASEPPIKKASVTNVSSVRRTTPPRTTPPRTTSSKKSSFKKPSTPGSAPKARNGQHRNGQHRNGQHRNGQLQGRQVRIPLFFGVGIGLSLLAGGLKAIAAALADAYLYSLPWAGGFLRSIELSEISNLVVFALLAGGIGRATIWLPRRWNPWAKIGLLLAVSPFVFSASYMMQQRLWIRQVAELSDISYLEAEQITNSFLKQQTGSGGFFGYYAYSTQVAELPTSRARLEQPSSGNPSEVLTRELASYDDPRADLVAYVFARIGWLLRWMYMAIATLTALIYYFGGREWVENKQMEPYGRTSEASKPSRPRQTRP